MKTLDRIWIAYLLTVLIVALLTPGGGEAAHRPAHHLLVHSGLLLAHLVLYRCLRGATARRARLFRAVAAVVSLPIVFSGMGWLLPAVHPEPYEWTWIAWDRAIFGGDPTVALSGALTPLFVEVLQWVYASFYLIPIAAALTVGFGHGWATFDRAMCILVFGFLVSYLGYLLWPTLPPYRFLEHDGPIQGVWLTETMRKILYWAEANRWDCFPSGHTMLSLLSLAVVWRWARPAFWVFLPIVVLLVFSTVALRYHYVCDVIVGALMVMPALWLADVLLRADAPVR